MDGSREYLNLGQILRNSNVFSCSSSSVSATRRKRFRRSYSPLGPARLGWRLLLSLEIEAVEFQKKDARDEAGAFVAVYEGMIAHYACGVERR